ncbi:hypothetical protein TWF718_006728 [Orbilia javanica]|uniref:Uncharacterized protein n=1 Tax=Orbilia javanica TaxID=47235 RepID=A0AAN8RCN2_9PEZI
MKIHHNSCVKHSHSSNKIYLPTLLASVSVVLVSIADLTSASCVFIDAVGNHNENIHGYGLGFDKTTPRTLPARRNSIVCKDCTGSIPDYECKDTKAKNTCDEGPSLIQDAVRFRNKVYFSSNKAVLNSGNLHEYLPNGLEKYKDTIIPVGGYVNVTKEIGKLALSQSRSEVRTEPVLGNKSFRVGIPKVSAGGFLNITKFQVDAHGAGPFSCWIDFQGAGLSWPTSSEPPLSMTTNCVAKADSFDSGGVGNLKTCWLKVMLPSNLHCKGKYGKEEYICLIRCQNRAKNGPFGGCIPIQQRGPIPITKTVTEGQTTITSTKIRIIVETVTTTTTSTIPAITTTTTVYLSKTRTIRTKTTEFVTPTTTVTLSIVSTTTTTVPTVAETKIVTLKEIRTMISIVRKAISTKTATSKIPTRTVTTTETVKKKLQSTATVTVTLEPR